MAPVVISPSPSPQKRRRVTLSTGYVSMGYLAGRTSALRPRGRGTRAQGTPNLLDKLPNDLLSRILFSGFFDTVHVLHRLVPVCKRFLQVAQASFCSMDLRKLALDPVSLGRLVETFPAVTSLDLSYCRAIDDGALDALKPLRGSLRALRLKGCSLTDRGVRAITGFTRLEELQISRSTAAQTTRIGDAALASLAALRALRHLDMAWCKRLSDKSVQQIAASCRALAHVDLQCCVHIGDLSVQALAQHPLEHLDLAGCMQLTDEGLSALCSIRSLRWLSLKHVSSLTDHTVCALLEALPELRHLDIRDCERVSKPLRQLVARRMAQRAKGQLK